MSVSAGLDVRLLCDGKNVMYIVDWRLEVGITDDEIINVLKAKNHAHEPLGVPLSWLYINIGSEFIIHQDLSLLLSCSNHQKINRYGITDFDWYLSNIIPVFNNVFSIESFGLPQDS